MTLSNGQVWEALEQVRLRQVPWHKRATIFEKLQAAGLLEPVPQTTVASTGRPFLQVASLTDEGKKEVVRLATCRRDEAWRAEDARSTL